MRRRGVVFAGVSLGVFAVLVLSGYRGQTTAARHVREKRATLNGTVTWHNGDGPGSRWYEYAPAADRNLSWQSTRRFQFGELACRRRSCSRSFSVNVSALYASTNYVYRMGGCLERNGTPCGAGIAYFDQHGDRGGTHYTRFTTGPGQPPEPKRTGVTAGFDRTEDPESVATGVPVAPRTSPGGPLSVVDYSVRVENLSSNSVERVLTRGIADLSTCQNPADYGNPHGITDYNNPCQQYFGAGGRYPHHTPYAAKNSPRQEYVPTIAAKVTMTSAPTGDPSRGTVVVPWRSAPCSNHMHRCGMLYTSANFAPGINPPRPAYFNLFVSAYSPEVELDANNNPKDVLELKADCAINGNNQYVYTPCVPTHDNIRRGAVASISGQLSIARLGQSYTLPSAGQFVIPSTTRVPISSADATRAIIVKRVRLTGLHAGDVVDARGVVAAKNDPSNGGFQFQHWVGSEILLTQHRNARALHYRGRDPYGEWITPLTGQNCVNPNLPPLQSPCIDTGPATFEKGGVVSVPDGYDGRTMYVNFIVVALASSSQPAPQSGAWLDLVSPSELDVACMDDRGGLCGEQDAP
jgi:hypothetical protein